MINNVASTIQAQPVVQSVSVNQSSTKLKMPIPTDSVQLSTYQPASHEATESTDHTAKEAFGGDHQAQRLLAKEAASKDETRELLGVITG